MRRSRSVARRVARRVARKTAKAQRRKVSRKRRSRSASRLRTAKRVAKRVSKVTRRSNRRSSRRRVGRRSSKMRGGAPTDDEMVELVAQHLENLDKLNISESNENLILVTCSTCRLREWKDKKGNDMKKKVLATLKKAEEEFRSNPQQTEVIEGYLKKLLNVTNGIDSYNRTDVEYLELDEGEVTTP